MSHNGKTPHSHTPAERQTPGLAERVLSPHGAPHAPRKHVVIFLVCFVLLEAVLFLFADKPLSEALRQLDADAPGVINFFRSITDAGLAKWYLWPSGLAMVLFLPFAFSRMPALGTRLRARRDAWAVTLFFLCISLTGLLADFLKPMLGRARPKLLEQEGLYGFFPFTTGADYASMPSGHATTVFALAAVLMSALPRAPWATTARLAILAYAVVVALSRVMVNAHFLSDVVAGAAAGWLVAIAIIRLFRLRGLPPPHDE